MNENEWVKSSFSFSNGNCVEVTFLPGDMIGMRDSKDRNGPILRFSRKEFRAFADGVLKGDFAKFT